MEGEEMEWSDEDRPLNGPRHSSPAETNQEWRGSEEIDTSQPGDHCRREESRGSGNRGQPGGVSWLVF